MQTKKVRPAKGMRGLIMNSPNSGGPFFRIYYDHPDGERTFKDYSIMHHDFEVEILDDDAYFYETRLTGKLDGDGVLDHSPETLGLMDDVRTNPASALLSPSPIIRELAEDLLALEKKDE